MKISTVITTTTTTAIRLVNSLTTLSYWGGLPHTPTTPDSHSWHTLCQTSHIPAGETSPGAVDCPHEALNPPPGQDPLDETDGCLGCEVRRRMDTRLHFSLTPKPERHEPTAEPRTLTFVSYFQTSIISFQLMSNDLSFNHLLSIC